MIAVPGRSAAGVPDGVLLDLDGTLIDSEPMHRAAFRSFFASRGWDVPETTHRHFMGRRGSDVFATLSGPWADEDPDALVAEVLSHLDHDTEPPVEMPGAVELVRSLHARGVAIGLVTSANRAWAEYAVGELLGLRDCFAALVTWEDYTAGKPDPAPYRAGLAAIGVTGPKAAAIEDTTFGIASARAAGIARVVGLTSTTPADDLRAHGATRIVDSLHDLL